jgi:hypothetical protein
MAHDWKAPGSCVDCGNDAYIRLGAHNGTDDMLCAHCYAERIRKGLIPKSPESVRTPSRVSGVRPQ